MAGGVGWHLWCRQEPSLGCASCDQQHLRGTQPSGEQHVYNSMRSQTFMNALVAAKVLIISFSSRMSPCHKTPVLVSQAVLIPARHHTTQAIEHFSQRTHVWSHMDYKRRVHACQTHDTTQPQASIMEGLSWKSGLWTTICCNLAVGAKPSVTSKRHLAAATLWADLCPWSLIQRHVQPFYLQGPSHRRSWQDPTLRAMPTLDHCGHKYPRQTDTKVMHTFWNNIYSGSP